MWKLGRMGLKKGLQTKEKTLDEQEGDLTEGDGWGEEGDPLIQCIYTNLSVTMLSMKRREG